MHWGFPASAAARMGWEWSWVPRSPECLLAQQASWISVVVWLDSARNNSSVLSYTEYLLNLASLIDCRTVCLTIAPARCIKVS